MPQITHRPGNYVVPCPQCDAGVPIQGRGGGTQRTICHECGHLLVATWAGAAFLLSSYPVPGARSVPRQGEFPAEGRTREGRTSEGRTGAPGRYPVTRMDTACIRLPWERYLAAVRRHDERAPGRPA